MSIKKSLAIVVSIFLMASGLDAAAAANPVAEVTKLLTAVRANNYESSVAVAARAEFIKLNPGQLGQILQAREFDALFVTPYGFSLIHGWMLSYFSHHDLPFYINSKFSFDAYFSGMVAAIQEIHRPLKDPLSPSKLAADTDYVKKIGLWKNFFEMFNERLLSKWNAAKASIEPNRWAYYEQMQYMHAAIMQAGVVGKITTMPAIIKGSFIRPVTTSASSIPRYPSTATPGKMPQTASSPVGSSFISSYISQGIASAFKGSKSSSLSSSSPSTNDEAEEIKRLIPGGPGTPIKKG